MNFYILYFKCILQYIQVWKALRAKRSSNSTQVFGSPRNSSPEPRELMSWPELSFPWFLPFSTSLIGLSIYYKVEIRKLCSCIYFLGFLSYNKDFDQKSCCCSAISRGLKTQFSSSDIVTIFFHYSFHYYKIQTAYNHLYMLRKTEKY